MFNEFTVLTPIIEIFKGGCQLFGSWSLWKIQRRNI